MGEIAKLTAGSNGELDPADFERTVESLLSGGSDPVITEHPGDAAWTHEITDKALQLTAPAQTVCNGVRADNRPGPFVVALQRFATLLP